MKKMFLAAIVVLFMVAGMQGVAAYEEYPCGYLYGVCRDLPASVGTGDTFEANLTSNVNTSGIEIHEVLMEGVESATINYTYNGADDVTVSGHDNEVTFTVTDFAADGFTITYQLKAPETPGNYSITGDYQAMGENPKVIEGDTSINVGASKCLIYTNPDLDSDEDGWTDVEELEAGTSPFDNEDQPTKQNIIDIITEWINKYFSVF